VRIKRACADVLDEPVNGLAIAERPDPGVGQSGHPGIEPEPEPEPKPRRVG
jgi:hypothetical protein